MMLKVNGVWEAHRIVDCLASKIGGCVYGDEWLSDVVARLGRQAEAEKARRMAKEERGGGAVRAWDARGAAPNPETGKGGAKRGN